MLRGEATVTVNSRDAEKLIDPSLPNRPRFCKGACPHQLQIEIFRFTMLEEITVPARLSCMILMRFDQKNKVCLAYR